MKGDGRIFSRLPRSPYWWVEYYHNGKQHREVAKHVRTGEKLEAIEAKRHEAERFLTSRVKQVITEKGGGPAFVTPTQQRCTVGDLLDSLKSDYELRGKWNDRTESTVKKVRERFGAWRATAVTSEAVANWQLDLREAKYKDATINRFCQVLGQSFALAIENKRLSSAPVIKHLSETGNARSGFFTETEIRSVISHLPAYLQDFTLFAYITGMRKGEVQSLKWSDVHGDAITLRAENSKNGEGRTIALEGELAELIERRREVRKVKDKKGNVTTVAEYIFHLKGQRIGEFRKAWATACKFANVPGRLFHDLRRCAARNLIKAGVPQVVAMRITGHKTDSMFRRYAIVEEAQQREALKAAEAYRQQQLEQDKAKVAQMPARTQ
ncbi:MAG TPA: site-specific integrase [Terriglobales bacterium]|nr:site-specific integrase [Terriglobales bacterium]